MLIYALVRLGWKCMRMPRIMQIIFMLIGGLERLSLIDYPGKLSAIIFTKNCNFRCPFCYNPMLVCPSGSNNDSTEEGKKEGHSHQEEDDSFLIGEDDFFQFLKKRIGKLEAVVITGGEPTLHKDLPEFIDRIKALGFLVKLDTNGSNPELLEKLVRDKKIDYIAMDLKTDEKNYQKTVRVNIDFSKIAKSVKIIMGSNLPYEFRTTCVPGLMNRDVIFNMSGVIEGADKWYLQKFKSNTRLMSKDLMNKDSFSEKEMDAFVEIGKKHVKLCEKRG